MTWRFVHLSRMMSATAQPAPIAEQTWQIMLTPAILRAYCETLRRHHEFRVGETELTWT